MPILKNAKKDLRVSHRKAEVNNKVRSRLKTFTDAFKKTPSDKALSGAFSAIDRAVKGKILHKNTAARRKAQLAKMLGAK